jgi:hypothetical protein
LARDLRYFRRQFAAGPNWVANHAPKGRLKRDYDSAALAGLVDAPHSGAVTGEIYDALPVADMN